MTGRLKDKLGLVIGAGRIGLGWGNGKGAALDYGREGATVICVDNNVAAAAETAELVRAEGARSLALAADVCDEYEIRSIVSATLDQHDLQGHMTDKFISLRRTK